MSLKNNLREKLVENELSPLPKHITDKNIYKKYILWYDFDESHPKYMEINKDSELQYWVDKLNQTNVSNIKVFKDKKSMLPSFHELSRSYSSQLLEAKYLVNADNLDDVVDNVGDEDTIKVVDESEESHNGTVSPLKLDPNFEKMSKSEERVNKYEMVKPKMTKEELQETVKKILNNGK